MPVVSYLGDQIVDILLGAVVLRQIEAIPGHHGPAVSVSSHLDPVGFQLLLAQIAPVRGVFFPIELARIIIDLEGAVGPHELLRGSLVIQLVGRNQEVKILVRVLIRFDDLTHVGGEDGIFIAEQARAFLVLQAHARLVRAGQVRGEIDRKSVV